ncbi:hypothetical protein NESM_000551500 [Novymonas esmeraldas]|uniref:Thioredoxin domain-containing protein n=1 Tax=Novymonas esmeraldas TaxID=1808958 RepID=A0AAW0EPS2_9TRYP
MQTQAHKDVVKDITTASQLESELQLSQAQHGVAVLDVYNAEWGHCKALSDTFRRLFTDAGDLVHLRFFSVECNAVLESLSNPEEAKVHHPRQKGMEFSKDTLVSFWKEMLEQRQNHSKPYFAFYKEGKMRTHVEGIDTPKICRIVNDLCKQQNAASEFIRNPDVLRFWESHFSLSENEVAASEFARAVRGLLGAAAAELSEEDVADVTTAVQSVSGPTVTAAHLQAFVGDHGTMKDAVLAAITTKRATAAVTRAAPPQQKEAEKSKPHSPTVANAGPSASPHSPPATAADATEAAAELDEGREVDAGESDSARATSPRADAQDEELPEPATEEAADAGAADTDAQELDEPAETYPAEEAAAPQPDGDEADDAHAEHAENVEEAEAEEKDTEAAEVAAAAAVVQGVAAVESPLLSPSLPSPGHAGHGAVEAAHAPVDEPREENQTPASPAAVAAAGDVDDESERQPEEATALSEPAMDTEELGDGDAEEEVDEAPSSAQPTDTVNVTAEQDESTINQIFTNRWVTVTEEEMHVWNTVAALPLHYPESTTLMADLTCDTAPAHAALSTTADLPTLAEFLTAQGVSYSDINMMCIAADQKVGSESLSYGKLSLILMSCDAEEGKGLVPQCETFLKELSDGTLLTRQQPLAFTALALSASEAYPEECFCYCVPETAAAAFQALAVDDVFVLNALTPLRTAVPQDGNFVLRIVGLPKVIELATTDESEDTMVLSQWYARLRVVEQGTGSLTARFAENVCDEEFQDFLTGYIARLIEDENRLDKKHGDEEEKAAEGEFNDEELGDGESAEAATPEPDAEM